MAFNPEPEYHIETVAINIRHFHVPEEVYRPPALSAKNSVGHWQKAGTFGQSISALLHPWHCYQRSTSG